MRPFHFVRFDFFACPGRSPQKLRGPHCTHEMVLDMSCRTRWRLIWLSPVSPEAIPVNPSVVLVSLHMKDTSRVSR